MAGNLKKTNYISIGDWMLQYGLTTRELMTYAIVYGFNNDPSGSNRYYASLETLASWLGIKNRNHALDHLKSLVEKGLITKNKIKESNSQVSCEYYVTTDRTLLPENDPDCDYISIQPFMIGALGLRNAELLLYAVIHSYSRRGSGNHCKYNKTYLGKWLSCRKDNVAIYVKKLKDRGLIEEVETSDGIGFIALIPEGSNQEVPKNRNTSLKTGNPKKGNTLPKNRNTDSLKNVTNNLALENLEDNLISSNNNSYESNSSRFETKDELSVVVNKDYPDLEDSDLEPFAFKQDADFTLYCKYSKLKNRKVDLALFMQKYSMEFFRMILSLYPNGKSKIIDVGELLLGTVTNRRFDDRNTLINGLSKKECLVLFDEAMDLVGIVGEQKPVSKSKEAYMIGVLENILESKA